MINKRLQEHYDHVKSLGYEIFGLYLQGSQNYGLATPQSDIDSKCIVIPTLDDIVSNREPVSTTLIMPNEEHIDVKDIRIMFSTFLKQNINFIEICFTKYKIINPFYADFAQQLYNMREDVAHIDFNKAINCIVGMSQQKHKALKHPYPTIKDKIDKYGYDPKQLHHIVRMNYFIKKYASGTPYELCLIEEEQIRQALIDCKITSMPLEKAEKLAQDCNDDTYAFSKTILKDDNPINNEVIDKLLHIQKEAIIRYIKKEINNV